MAGLAGERRAPPRPERIFNFDTNLTAEQRMEAMMAGGLTQSKGALIGRAAKELAGKRIGLFKEKVQKC